MPKIPNETVHLIWTIIFIVLFLIIFILIRRKIVKYYKKKYHYAYWPTDKHEKETNEPEQPQIPLYEKKALLTANERMYQEAIQHHIPRKYKLLPQICLASVIQKNYNNKYINELFRIVDFGIFDKEDKPIVLIEINDSSHYYDDRIERDNKVKTLLEQANIPLITLWTEYGIKEDYIEKKIKEYIK